MLKLLLWCLAMQVMTSPPPEPSAPAPRWKRLFGGRQAELPEDMRGRCVGEDGPVQRNVLLHNLQTCAKVYPLLEASLISHLRSLAVFMLWL